MEAVFNKVNINILNVILLFYLASQTSPLHTIFGVSVLYVASSSFTSQFRQVRKVPR